MFFYLSSLVFYYFIFYGIYYLASSAVAMEDSRSLEELYYLFGLFFSSLINLSRLADFSRVKLFSIDSIVFSNYISFSSALFTYDYGIAGFYSYSFSYSV
jgi:hypothetical protein